MMISRRGHEIIHWIDSLNLSATTWNSVFLDVHRDLALLYSHGWAGEWMDAHGLRQNGGHDFVDTYRNPDDYLKKHPGSVLLEIWRPGDNL